MEFSEENGYDIQEAPEMLKSGEIVHPWQLSLDEAIVNVYNRLKTPVDICWQSCECFECNDISQGILDAGHNRSIILTSRYKNQIKVKSVGDNSNQSIHCQTIRSLADHGVYNMTLNDDDCVFETHDPGRNELIPIWVMIGSYLLLTVILFLIHYLWRSYKNSGDKTGMKFSPRGFNRLQSTNNSISSNFRNIPPTGLRSNKSQKSVCEDNEEVLYSRERMEAYNNVNRSPNGIGSTSRRNSFDEEEEERKRSTAVSIERVESELRRTPNGAKKRIKSLDAFRGLVIIMMIFVNSGGGGYSFFNHSSWYGITLADVIFPSFIMIMGFSTALSIRSRLMQKKDFVLIAWKILRRTSKLFFLGIMLNTDKVFLKELRIMGVLQRFAISYFFVASLHLLSVYRGNKFLTRPEEPSVSQAVGVFLPEILTHTGFLGIYLYYTFAFKYDEDCPLGYQGPGGLERHSRFFNCTGGAANYIDRLILGEKHMYHWSTSKKIFRHTLDHEPEGILGLTTSILLTEFGLICGRIIIKARSHYTRLIRWFILSSVAGFLAFGLASIRTQDFPTGLIPVVKNLWSLSFVLATGSIALMTFLIFYLLIDTTYAWKNGFPFHFAGSNAILLYLGHQIMGPYFPFSYQVDDSSHGWLLLRCSITTTLWLLIAIYLHKKKIFLTV